MRRAIVVGVVVAGGIIAWLYWYQHRPVPLVVSGFIEADQIRVGSRVGGRVAKVLVHEGQSVTAGTPLFRIAPFDLKEKLAEAEAELAALQAEQARLVAGYQPEDIERARARRDQAAATLARLQAGPRQAEIEIGRQELNRAKANLELAQSEHERLLTLKQEGRSAQVEYDEAVRAFKSTQAEAAAAEQRLALLLEGTRKEEIAGATAALAEADHALKLMEQGYRKEDIAQAGAKVQAAEQRIAAIKVLLAELTVTAPSDCVVEAIDLQPGDLVQPNVPTASLLDVSRMWVRAYVPESRLGQVSLDQRVPIKVDNFPDERFTGRVAFISQQAEFTPRNVQTPEERSKQVFRIKVVLEEGLSRLRVGMSADVLFEEAVTP